MFLATEIWNWIWPIALGLLVGVLLAGRKNVDYSKIVRLKPEEFRQNMRKGQLIDIRTESQFEARRINGSRNFPKMSAFQNLSKLRPDLAVFVYDETDSILLRRFCKKLIRKGFVRVYCLQGGLKQWPYNLKEE
jgi:rhodanese-related sulfurtransferase